MQRDPMREEPVPSAGVPTRGEQSHAELEAGKGIEDPYRVPFWKPRSPAVQRDIAALHPERDCERIVELLATYEFPFDIQRSLEIALFHTYGSQSVARLLHRTGEFRERGQKRYDDTRLLIAHFMESGLGRGVGTRAVGQMNHIHSFYKIPNEDYLFVLWTFIDFPIQWMREFGWRAFSDHESQAWFHFWSQVGRRMGLSDIPETKAAFDAFVLRYEEREFVSNVASHEVAQATFRIIENWLPEPLRFAVPPVVLSLVGPRLMSAIGERAPAPWVKRTVRGVLRARGVVKRYVSLERLPSRIAGSLNRSYPGNRYAIEGLGPQFANRER